MMNFVLLMTLQGLLLNLACGAISNFRRDNWLDEKQYPEGLWAPVPKEGGRLQFISTVEKNLVLSNPLKVDFGSFSVTLDPDMYEDQFPMDGFDWARVSYNPVSGSLMTSMHVHTDKLLGEISQIRISDANNQVISDEKVTVPESSPDLQVTYGTSTNGFTKLVVHIHNYGKDDQTIDKLDINSGFIVSSESIKLADGEHIVREFDMTDLQMKENSLWTVEINGEAGYGGRLIKEFFPIEDWPKSSQCPYPVDGANEDNFKKLQDTLHVNTHFYKSACDADDKDVYEAAAKSDGSWYVFPSESKWTEEPGKVPDTAYKGIAAAFVGDESDGSLEYTLEVWNRVLTAQRNYNDTYATYCGGHSNHLNGAFSGIADIQGMDFYVGACAPHVTEWTSTMRIQGAFDYLRNARENHKPLPTWLYSQGFCSDCWSVENLNSGELLVQLASVLAAGGKGLMLFQSDLELYDSNSWNSASNFLSSVSYMGEWLRVADPEGARFTTDASSNSDAIVEVLRALTGLLLVVISTKASGYNDKTCVVSGKHWTFEEQTISKTSIELPSDLVALAASNGETPSSFFKLSEVKKDSLDSSPDDVDMSIDDDDNAWNVNDLKLGSSSTVVRLFLLEKK